MVRTLPITGLLIALGCLVAGGFGVPLPNFVVLIYAGSTLTVMQFGLLAGLIMVCGGVAGVLLGDLFWFAVGRRSGAGILQLVCRLSISRDTCVRNTAELFARKGLNLLLISRFMPGLSLVTSPLAGASGVSMRRFAVYDAAGTAIWIAACLAIGFVMADQVAGVVHIFRQIGMDLGGAAITVTACYIGFKWFRRRLLIRQLRMARISVTDLAELIATGTEAIILDVRAQIQRDDDPFVIPGARLVDLAVSDSVLRDVPKERAIIAYCSCPNEISAALVSRRLHKLGLTRVRPLAGGIDAWRLAGFSVEPLGVAR